MKKIALYKTKLIIYNKHKLIIENYNQVIKYDTNEIIVDCYEIKGSNLSILLMDELNIIIIGNDYEIRII